MVKREDERRANGALTTQTRFRCQNGPCPRASDSRRSREQKTNFESPMSLPDGILAGEDGVPRCWWSNGAAEYQAYHDKEWGRPVTDDRRLFEKLCLEG